MSLDLTNDNQLDEDFSNFRIFGIGKPTEKQIMHKQRRRDFRKQLGEELKHGHAGKALLTLSQRYNPASAIPRGGVLAGARVNVFGISVRLYPAFLTPEEAKKKKIRLDAIEPAKKAWDKVSNFWRGLGGNPESLKEAVMLGYDKPVFKFTKGSKKRMAIAKESGFNGSLTYVSVENSRKPMDIIPTALPSGDRLEDEVFNDPHENSFYRYNPKKLVVAFSPEWSAMQELGAEEEYASYDGGASIAISAGIALLGSIAGLIAKSGAKKNPYEEGVNEQITAQITEAEKEAQPATAEEMKAIEDAVAEERKAGLPLDEGDGAGDGKILGIPKTAFWIGVGLITLIGGYFVYKKFIKK